MKAFKCLGVYNFFVCGWAKDVGSKLLNDSNCRLIYARVSEVILIEVFLFNFKV